MEIKIETDKINELELSPSEYIILYLLYSKEYKTLEDLVVAGTFDWVSGVTFKGILGHLEVRGWLKLTSTDLDFESIVLRQKTLNIFEIDKNQKYNILWTNFPIKVSDGNGGFRVLKAKGHDSEDYKKGLKLWNDIIKKEDPDVVIKALDKQLLVTRSKLQYTQNFLTWLRNKTYQKYVDMETEPDGDSKTERL